MFTWFLLRFVSSSRRRVLATSQCFAASLRFFARSVGCLGHPQDWGLGEMYRALAALVECQGPGMPGFQFFSRKTLGRLTASWLWGKRTKWFKLNIFACCTRKGMAQKVQTTQIIADQMVLVCSCLVFLKAIFWLSQWPHDPQNWWEMHKLGESPCWCVAKLIDDPILMLPGEQYRKDWGPSDL